MHRRASSSSRNEQCSSLLPRKMGETTNQMVSLDNNQFGVTGPIVRESDDLVADRDVPDRASDCLDEAGNGGIDVLRVVGKAGRRITISTVPRFPPFAFAIYRIIARCC
jgi:hypothetical protein